MTLEQLKQQDKKYAQVIANYLIKRCEEDKFLENKILNTNKTLVGCINYCKSEAQKEAVDGCAICLDEDVYNWCVHYFLEDSLDFESKPKPEKKGKEKKPTKVKKEETEKIDTLFGVEEVSKQKDVKPKISSVVKKKSVKEELGEQLSLFDLE